MEQLNMKFYQPIVTGTPHLQGISVPAAQQPQKAEGAQAFEALLKQQLEENGGVSFSKHALKRAAEKNIEISDESLARLNEGVKMAGQKNLGDTLIMVDQLAFLVNVKNQTVITALKGGDKANIFTNIDGTVIV